MAPKPSGKPHLAAPKLASPVADPKFYKGPTVAVNSSKNGTPPAAGKAKTTTTTSPSPRSSPSPSFPRSKRSSKASSSSLSLSSLLLRACILWFFSSLFLCSPTLTPETSAICYPASAYHSTLQPHLQPHLQSLISTSQSYLSPYYRPHLHHLNSLNSFIQPKAQSITRIATPYVQTIQRGYIRLYRTHVAPRIHYGKLRFTKASRPYIREVELRWKHLVKPHLEKANKSIQGVWEKVARDERVKLVGKKVGEWVKTGGEGAKKAWEQGRPLVVKGWKEGRKQWTETVVPVGKKGYGLVKKHGYEGGVVASTYASHAHVHILTPASQKLHHLYLSKVYRPYLAQHIDPVIAKVSPVVSTIVHTLARIANPIIYHVGNLTSPIYHKYFPAAPVTPPTLLEKIQDKLNSFVPPSAVAEEEIASHPVVTPAVVVPPATSSTTSSATPSPTPSLVADDDEDEDEDESFLAELESSSDPSTVEVPKHAVVEVKEEPAAETEEEERERLERAKEEVKEKRAEIEKDHENWERKVKKVGEFEEGLVLEKLVSTRSKAVSAFPSISRTWISALEREANKISKSLDKYFSRSSSNLTGVEIQAAVEKAGKRFSGKIEEVSEGVNGWLEGVEGREEEIVQSSFEKVNSVASQATAELGMPYAWLDDVTVADWTRYHKLPQMALDWQKIYQQHAVSDSHPLLATPETDMEKLVKDFKEEVEELEDGFAARIGILKVNAILKADADARALSLENGDEEEEETLFPIAGIWGDAVDASEVVLGKGKQQVLDALSAASLLATASTTSSSSPSSSEPTATPSSVGGGFVEVASEAIFGAATTLAGNDDSHIVNQAASSSASDVFEAATTSAGNVVDQATETVSSLLVEASEAFETLAANHPVVEAVVEGYEAVQEVRSEISETVAEQTRKIVGEARETETGKVVRDEL